jgi:hypothetical protein
MSKTRKAEHENRPIRKPENNVQKASRLKIPRNQ